MVKTPAEIMEEKGLVPAAIPKPSMDTSLPNTIRFSWPDEQVTIKVESIWKDRQGIHAWLTFWTQTNGVILGPERLNLQSHSGKTPVLKALRDREPRSWAEYLQHVVWETSEHLKNDGVIHTAASYTPKPEPPWLVWPLVKADVVNTCFADGGAGKSTLYAAVCVSGAAGHSIVPGLNVSETFSSLYVDFEASPDDVIGAAHALAKGAELADGWQERFIYRRMGGSLAENIEAIQRTCVEFNVKLVIIDSLVGSAGSDPNDAETARVFFAASMSLPDTAIVGLTHVSKGSEDSPLGSVMYRNLPRIVWQMKRDEDTNVVGLIPNKINTLGQRPKAFALELETIGDAIRYVSTDMATVPSLSVKLKLPDRITALLRNGSLDLDSIADELDAKKANVTTTLNRGRDTRFEQNAATGTWRNHPNFLAQESGEEGITSTAPVRGADVIPTEDNKPITTNNVISDVIPSPPLPGDHWDN